MDPRIKLYIKKVINKLPKKKSAPSKKTKRIAVLHIPKTAGTSLRKLIEYNCANSNLIYYYPPKLVSDVLLYNHGLLIGHYNFGYEDKFFEDCERVTFLRSAAARTASQLKFDKRYYTDIAHPNHKENQQWFANNDLMSFIEHSKLWYYDNAMVRMLADNTRSLNFGQVTEQHLQIAKDNLDKFDFVGFQDNFSGSLNALCERYGWENIEFKSNISAEKHAELNLNDSALNKYNYFDNELYDYAKSQRG